jgi:diaminopimelate decarboxylase
VFDDATIKELAEEHSSGFYICDLDRFEENYRSFLWSFKSIYPKTRLAYSYKTNYLPTLCIRIDELGGYAEVVSRMEYEIARSLGVSGPDIIFNGPVKTGDDYLKAALAGSVVNVDSDYEIAIIEALADEHPELSLRLGIRCAVNLQGASPSRFGFDTDGSDFFERVDRLRAIANVSLEGLHCHTIPPGRSASNYAIVARRLLDLGRKIWGAGGPRFIDLGGGYFSNMSPELRSQFGGEIPTFDDYGGAIAGVFADAFGDGNGPELILEPGLAVVADAFHFVCRVVDIKRAGSKIFALVAGSVYNVRPTKSRRNLPVRRIENGIRSLATGHPPLDVVGYTCMEDDVLHRDYDSTLSVGDLLVFDNVGAYSLVLKPPFIQGDVPVVACRDGQAPGPILKRAETIEDIMATHVVVSPGTDTRSPSPVAGRMKDAS